MPSNFQPTRCPRPSCANCRRRPALTRIRGEYRVVEGHDLCRQCWQSLLDSRRARLRRARREVAVALSRYIATTTHNPTKA